MNLIWRRSRKCQKYVRILSRLSCVRRRLIFESLDCHHISMPWSFLISFWNTSLITGPPLLFPCCVGAHHFCIISLTSETCDWNRLVRCCRNFWLPSSPSIFTIDCAIQFVVNQKYYCTFDLFPSTSSTFHSIWRFYIFGELMLPIWQAKRKMDIRWTMQRFPSCSSWLFFFSCLCRISSSMNFVFLWMNLMLLAILQDVCMLYRNNIN